MLDRANQIWPEQFYIALTGFEFLARKQDPAAALALLGKAHPAFDNSAATPVDRIVDPRGYRPEFAEEWRRYLEVRNKSPVAISAVSGGLGQPFSTRPRLTVVP